MSITSFAQAIGRASTRLYHDEKSHLFEKHLASRVGNLVSGVSTIPATLIDTALAVPSLISILGFNQQLYVGTKELLNSSQMVLSRSYRSILTTVNPNAFHGKYKQKTLSKQDSVISANSDLSGSGFVSEFVKVFFKKYALKCARAKGNGLSNALQRQLASRVLYATTYTFSAAARIPDFAIGCILLPVGVVFTLADLVGLGNRDIAVIFRTDLNSVVFRALQVGGIVRDLFKGIAKTFNPWIGEREKAHVKNLGVCYLTPQKKII